MDYSFISSWKSILQVITKGSSDFGSLHPVIVHLPIALLLVSPLFIILGLIFKKFRKPFYCSSLILLALGTLGIILAIFTGDAASDLIEPNPETLKTLTAHVLLAEQIRLNFILLTSILTTYIILMKTIAKKWNPKAHTAIITLYLLAYAYSLVLLFNTAHQGGKLVHHHGIKSSLYTHKPPENILPLTTSLP